MTKRSRQLFLSSIILFSVIGLPLILAYASGYRVNVRAWSIDQTGSMSIASLPKRSELTIEELGLNKTVPAIVNNLLPGEYTLVVTKADYQAWTDHISIEQRQSILLHSILLFYTEPAVENIESYPDSGLVKTTERRVSDFSPDVQYVLSQLELSAQYTISGSDTPMITVLDHERQMLYLINSDKLTAEVTELASDVLGFQWDTDSAELLYYTPFELVVYDQSSHATRVITRQSTQITEAIWHSRGGYILYSSGGQIVALETRLTDVPNAHVLYEGVSPNVLVLAEKGDVLYVTDEKEMKSVQLMEL